MVIPEWHNEPDSQTSKLLELESLMVVQNADPYAGNVLIDNDADGARLCIQ
jgi:hypothetical protein